MPNESEFYFFYVFIAHFPITCAFSSRFWRVFDPQFVEASFSTRLVFSFPAFLLNIY